MVSYANVISVGSGIIIMIAIGFVLAKARIVDPAHMMPVNRFLFKCCYIPLIAKNLIRQALADMNFKLFAVFVCAAMASQIALLLMMIYPAADRFGTYLGTMLPATFVNFVVIGFPIFESIWPDGDSSVLTIITLSNDLFIAPVYLTMTGVYDVVRRNCAHRQNGEPLEHFGMREIARIGLSLVSNPIMIGYMVGFLWAGAHIPVPLAMDEAIRYLSGACLPMSCLCIGAFLAEHSLISCHWTEFATSAFTRHIVYPMFAGLFASAFKLTPTEGRQTIIMGTLPSAVACYLLSTNAGIGAGVSSTMIFWSNILFLPATIVWFLVLDALKLFVED
jgi:predicted permease